MQSRWVSSNWFNSSTSNDLKESKRIKAALTLPQLSDTAQQVGQVVASERPIERPVLRGLIQETANKSTSNLEKHLKSLKDKMKAANLRQKTRRAMGRNLQRASSRKRANLSPQQIKHPRRSLRAQMGLLKAPATMPPCAKKAEAKEASCLIFDERKDRQRTSLRK